MSSVELEWRLRRLSQMSATEVGWRISDHVRRRRWASRQITPESSTPLLGSPLHSTRHGTLGHRFGIATFRTFPSEELAAAPFPTKRARG